MCLLPAMCNAGRRPASCRRRRQALPAEQAIKEATKRRALLQLLPPARAQLNDHIIPL